MTKLYFDAYFLLIGGLSNSKVLNLESQKNENSTKIWDSSQKLNLFYAFEIQFKIQDLSLYYSTAHLLKANIS